MSNDQLLVTMVEDAAVGSQLAADLVHQVRLKGCVLKPEALPLLDKAAQKLSHAANAAMELSERAHGMEEPKKGGH